MQSRLCHLERSMVIVDILPALAEAVAVQHRALRSLFSITAEQLPDDLALCRTQKRFRHDSRIADRSRLSDSFPLDPYTHAPHGATEAARPLR